MGGCPSLCQSYIQIPYLMYLPVSNPSSGLPTSTHGLQLHPVYHPAFLCETCLKTSPPEKPRFECLDCEQVICHRCNYTLTLRAKIWGDWQPELPPGQEKMKWGSEEGKGWGETWVGERWTPEVLPAKSWTPKGPVTILKRPVQVAKKEEEDWDSGVELSSTEGSPGTAASSVAGDSPKLGRVSATAERRAGLGIVFGDMHEDIS